MGEQRKKPIWKKWWIWLIALIVLVAMFGGGGEGTTDKDNTDTPKVVENNENNKKEEEKVEDKVFKVGETIQLDKNKLTVTKVEKSEGNEFDKPKQGKEYVIVHVKIENAGDKNIMYNSFDFKMSNSQGQIQDVSFSVVNSETALESGELAPGGVVEGSLVFEQPKDDQKLQLQYEVSFWSSKLIKVDMQ